MVRSDERLNRPIGSVAVAGAVAAELLPTSAIGPEVAAITGLLVEVALLERTSRTARVRADVDGPSLDLGVGELLEHRRGEVIGQVDEGVVRADVDMADLLGGDCALVRDRTDDGAGRQTLIARAE